MADVAEIKKQLMDEHKKQRDALFAKDDAQRFSSDIKLTPEEEQANKKWLALRNQVADNENFNMTIHNHFEQKSKIMDSKLYKVLDQMPKGAVHHMHTTAQFSLDVYKKLTYDDKAYYCEKENMFKVFTSADQVEEGYI